MYGAVSPRGYNGGGGGRAGRMGDERKRKEEEKKEKRMREIDEEEGKGGGRKEEEIGYLPFQVYPFRYVLRLWNIYLFSLVSSSSSSLSVVIFRVIT